jgi:hypothetical protein
VFPLRLLNTRYMVELLVIIVLCALLGWKEYQGRKERRELIQAIVSKNAAELANLQTIDKLRIEPSREEVSPDLIPEQQITDAEWDKFIREQQ